MSLILFPAGLNDQCFEIFKHANQIYALNNGQKLHYSQFPLALLRLIDELIEARPKARKALDQLGLIDKDERRIVFISCNLANFDFTADVSAALNKISTEYVECGQRGKCPHEGKLCSPVDVVDGALSMRELRTMGLIRKGLLNKEIAEALFISIETVKTTTRNAQKKLRVERKAMLSSVAATMQIT